MPQTISLVRGTTSVTGNGTSAVTLFTNSASGIATRVIVNQLTFYTNAAIASSTTMIVNLYHQSSGGYNSILGQIANIGATTTRTEQWLIGGFPSTKMVGNQQQGIGADSLSLGSTSTSAGGAQDVLFFDANTTKMQFGSNNSNAYFKHCPQTFWIGPSDLLKIKSSWTVVGGKGGVAATVAIGYSFTLITES